MNIDQPNPVKVQNMPDETGLMMQTSLDDDIIEYIPNVYYTQNTISATENPQYVAGALNTSIGASSQISKFQLPPSIYNHHKTTLSWLLTISANTSLTTIPTGADTTTVAAVHSFYNPIIQSIDFYTQAGTRLCKINSADKLNRLSGIINIKKEDGYKCSNRNFMIKSQRTYQNLTAVGYTNTLILNGYPDPYLLTTAGAINTQYLAQTLDDPSVMLIPYSQSVAGSGLIGDSFLGPANLAQVSTFRYSFRLGDLFNDSIFNVKKDLWFSNVSFIAITFNSLPQIGCFVKLDSFTGASVYSLVGPISASPVNSYSITSMELCVYAQNNQKICDAIITSQQKNSIPVVIPYVESSSAKWSPSSSTQKSTFKISTQNTVSYLYKLYYGVFLQDGFNFSGASAALTCNSSNINENVWTTTTVQINNNTIRPLVDLTKKEDIAEMCAMFPNNSITSYRAIRYSGVYALLLDTEPCKMDYDGQSLMGIEIKPNNSLAVTYTTQLSTAYTSTQQLDHYLFNVQNKMFFWKQGEAYYLKTVEV